MNLAVNRATADVEPGCGLADVPLAHLEHAPQGIAFRIAQHTLAVALEVRRRVAGRTLRGIPGEPLLIEVGRRQSIRGAQREHGTEDIAQLTKIARPAVSQQPLEQRWFEL